MKANTLFTPGTKYSSLMAVNQVEAVNPIMAKFYNIEGSDEFFYQTSDVEAILSKEEFRQMECVVTTVVVEENKVTVPILER